MSQNPHPSRSADFLSRLHDGELSAAERAHFESHRAHCAECRHAAAEFEAALSLYRSSRPAPAAPDLAARILRKLQARPPRRIAFGPSFGIDLRWAGAFAAAVVAAIIGSTIVGRREAAERLAQGPAVIPIVVESPAPAARNAAPVGQSAASGPPPGETAAKRSRSNGAASFEQPPAATRPATLRGEIRLEKQSAKSVPASGSEEKRKLEDLRERDAGAPADRMAAAPQTLAKSAEAPASPAAPPPEAAAARQTRAFAPSRSPEPAGGEGANVVAADSAINPARIRIEPLDGVASVPEVIGAEMVDLLAALRGSRFVVMIDAAGRVREARPEPSPRRRKDATATSRDEAAAPPPIYALRFAPGDGPRRLLVLVE